MLEEGKIININGHEGVVCFTGTYQEKNYVNIFFDKEEKPEFKIYQVVDEGDDIVFKIETDRETIDELSTLWIAREAA